MLATLPLVSCIMPTYNRPAFIPRAVDCFLRQDYPHKELVIVDDGTQPAVEGLQADERIRTIRLDKRQPVGAKRNLACQAARGEIIAHWDDDDWHAPDRLSYQVAALLEARADACGLNTLLFCDVHLGQAWQYIYPRGQRFWLGGSSLCYRRAFWEGHPFPAIDIGEDARFVWSGNPERMLVLPRWDFHVGILHGQNVAARPSGSYWHPYPVERIQSLLGSAWPVFAPDLVTGEAIDLPPAVSSAGLPDSERTFSMLTTALKADLQLPEFAAFNRESSLPWMRRWEMPFALFQAQLGSTMAVFDCSINPVNFQQYLARLFPDVHYRHWNPIQNGQFSLPFGIPDEAFDRVICINTLEHLLRPQRAALLRVLAGKLKPGGRLILTSDYYFDSFWQNQTLLQMQLVRADRQEVFNGYNPLSFAEWIEMCKEAGLQPRGEAGPEPREGDPALYLQQPPAPHACLGGVFIKGAEPPPVQARTIALALLTWNTSAVSIDSVHAYLREARMLIRLGHRPVLIICDNGSTDGTQDALRALEGKIDFEHRLIFNQRNAGNSIARNQIIDAALEYDADYLLFMDGDIEIVPFSSFAMLRYMENCGSRLGCIGADSANFARERGRVTPAIYSIDAFQKETTNLVAWTQYGMFRCAAFRDGIRFDESAPFDSAGWGFEDNDLAFQMEIKGYLNQRFFGMTYLHRDPRSSVRIMKNDGMDVNAMYTRRKQYVIDKWASNPTINNGPLMYVRRVEIQF